MILVQLKPRVGDVPEATVAAIEAAIVVPHL